MMINSAGNYIVRGENTEDAGPKRINLFDGTYKSGFRIVRFQIAGVREFFNSDCAGKITTDLVSTAGDVWNWGNQQEIGWATNQMPQQSVRNDHFYVVDDSIIVVEELYVYVHSDRSATDEVNYLIELEPVDLKDWEYSLSYVQGKSQG